MSVSTRVLAIIRGAIQPFFFGWIALVLAALVIYTVTASAPMLGDVTWQTAATFGTGLWLTAFGGTLHVGEATINMMPLFVTLLTCYASYVGLRRRKLSTWSEWAVAVAAQLAIVSLIGLGVKPPGEWYFALIGTFFLGGTTAVLAAREGLFAEKIWWQYVERAQPVFRILARTVALLLVVVLVLAFVAGSSRIRDIHGSYLASGWETSGFVLTQLLYLPNLAVWGLAWLLGPGFAVGAGTNFSIFGVSSAPLPAIPVLGALPDVGTSFPLAFAGLVLVFLGLGIARARGYFTDPQNETFRESLTVAGLASVGLAGLFAILGLMASGAIGPGRMSEAGPQPPLMLAAGLVVIGLPFVLGNLFARPETIAWVKEKLAKAESSQAAEPGDLGAEESAADEGAAGDALSDAVENPEAPK